MSASSEGAPERTAEPPAKPLDGTDVMILAAGLGTRMRPLTDHTPKPLLPVLGRPLLVWNLRALAALGARRVVINTYHLAAEMEAYVDSELAREFADPEAPPKPEVRLVRELVLLGTGGGLGNASPLLQSDPVLVWNVDLIYLPDISAALALHEQERALATLFLTRSPLHAKIALSGSKILSVAPDADPSNTTLWAYTGVMLLSQEALAQLPVGQFDELPPRLRSWASAGRLHGHMERAPFLEVGTLESYLRVHRTLAESPELLPGTPPAHVTPALGGYGYVDARATVEGGVTIEESLVLPGATVRSGSRIQRAIIGAGTEVKGDVFGACLAGGEARSFPILDRQTEARFASFLARHAPVWPREVRRVWKQLLPLHGDGSGRRLVRVTAGADSHILVAPAPAADPAATSTSKSASSSAPTSGTTSASAPNLGGAMRDAPGRALPIYPRRIGPDVPDEPTTFAYVAKVLSRRGVRAPDLRVHEPESGLLLVEDLGDQTLFDCIAHAEPERIRDLYQQAMRLLVQMQLPEGEPFDPDRVQSPTYTAEFALVFECGYFQREFVEGHRGGPKADAALEAEYRSIATQAAEGADLVLIHRDFQSRNLMVLPSGLAVIDFQGARLGPPFYDIVSLVYDPYVDLDAGLREELIRTFAERTGHANRAQELVPPTALARLLQALGAYGYLGGRLGKPGFLEHAPRALAHVATLAERDFPHLARLARDLNS
ncbi:MAG: phosphotransferase [Candidatus Eisenbacteria bacterium]